VSRRAIIRIIMDGHEKHRRTTTTTTTTRTTDDNMESRVKILGHPVHQMLIVFPLGLLSTAVIFDLIHLVTRGPTWSLVSYWMIAAGIIGGLCAAVFGLADWLKIPNGTRAHRLGMLHGLGNVCVVVLFAVSWFLRRPDPANPSAMAIIFLLIGGGLSLVTGWLGGELVDRLGVGVDDGAHLDAPSSLSGKPVPHKTP
jgi:uncharacterized membrane protein